MQPFLKAFYLNGSPPHWPSRCPPLGISFWRSCGGWTPSRGISLKEKNGHDRSNRELQNMTSSQTGAPWAAIYDFPPPAGQISAR